MTVPTLAPEVSRVTAESEKFLQYVVDAADQLGISLPAKQYVTAGEAVHDCEQVAVTMVGVNTGLPGDFVITISNCPVTWMLTLEVDIVRCGPTPNNKGMVSVEKLTSAASNHASDTSILMRAVGSKGDERFGALIASVSYLPPQGGFSVTRLSVQMSVD